MPKGVYERVERSQGYLIIGRVKRSVADFLILCLANFSNAMIRFSRGDCKKKKSAIA